MRRRGFWGWTLAVLLVLGIVSPSGAQEGVSFSWAGVTHYTLWDGSEMDGLDVGLPDTGNGLDGRTVAVSGPGGFHYTFTDEDISPWLGGTLSAFQWFPLLEEGHYTFTVTGADASSVTQVDLHEGSRALPVLDPATLQLRRMADGGYRVHWTLAPEARTYWYRLRIVDDADVPVYTGSRRQATTEDVPAGLLTDGAAYRVRIEVFDSPTFEQLFNRSHSPWIDFTPDPGHYDPRLQLVQSAAVNHRVSFDGEVGTGFSLMVHNAPTVSLIEVTGPAGFSTTFDLPTDYDPQFNEFLRMVQGSCIPGLYTFRIVSETVGAGPVEQFAYAQLTEAVIYPALDAATWQAEETPWGAIRLSWTGVDRADTLYYRVMLKDDSGWLSITTRRSQALVDLDPALLQGRSGLEWRVEVHDSENYQTVRNRRHGPFVPLAIQPYTGVRDLAGSQVRHRVNPDGRYFTDLWFDLVDNFATSPIENLWVSGPGGFHLSLADIEADPLCRYLEDTVSGMGYHCRLDSIPPAAGLFTFVLQDANGQRVLYDYQPEPSPVPVPDYRTFNVSVESNDNLRLTWAPVQAGRPVWYMASFLRLTDQTGDGSVDEVYNSGLLNRPVWSFSPTSLPDEPLMLRLQVRNTSNWSLVSERSMAVFVGWEGPGFDYSSVPNEDGDDLAANVDPDDTDASMSAACLMYGGLDYCPPAKAVGLTPSLPSPQAVGTAVTFTAGAQPAGGTYEYRFWLKEGATWTVVQNYGPSTQWTWSTAGGAAGTYYVQVDSRRVGSTANRETAKVVAYTLTAPTTPATGVTLTPSLASPQAVGTSVLFTAAGLPEGGSYEYRFWLKEGATWAVVQSYSASAQWTWSTVGKAPGTYYVQVDCRAVGSTVNREAAKVVAYTLTAPTTPATGVTLTPSLPSPQPVGTGITFTAAGLPDGGTYEYRFWLKEGATWTVVQHYSASAQWTWSTTGKAEGTYYVQVDCRAVGSTVNRQAAKVVAYVLAAPTTPATGVTLTPSLPSPQPVGTGITFTAAGLPEGGTYEYRFWLKEGAVWTVVQHYSAGAQWTWSTGGKAPGTYYVQADCRAAGSTANREAAKVVSYTLQ
ncbi:MAG: hypothetical protein AB1578_12900 [Thermodesulfobacteriota bacterium]